MAKYIIVHSIRVATDFVPETFGRLTTIGPKFKITQLKRRRLVAVFQCECGNCTVANVTDVRLGKTRSCGCLRKQNAAAQAESNVVHGHARELGGRNNLYIIHKGMIQRCYNHKSPQYRHYGGRGIRVCDRWLEPNGRGFMNFLSDVGYRPSLDFSLDRYPNRNGNYEPGNVRWATLTEQNRNKRTNIILTHNGKTQCLAAWAEELGIDYSTIHGRFRRGWDILRLLAPVTKGEQQC
jgi:hypothetical protein